MQQKQEPPQTSKIFGDEDVKENSLAKLVGNPNFVLEMLVKTDHDQR